MISWYRKYVYGVGTDFTIYCTNSTETEVIKVHKFILSGISYFDTNKDYIIITEYDSSAMLLFIDYCYLGQYNKDIVSSGRPDSRMGQVYNNLDKEQLSLLLRLSLSLRVPDLYNFVAKLL